MKTHHLLALAAGLTLLAGSAFPAGAPARDEETVIVYFKGSDNFSDVRENNSDFTSAAYLNELRACVQQTVAPLLQPGQKLTVTFTEIDLAGETRLTGSSHIRVIRSAHPPRMDVEFKLLDADGKEIKSGTRRLVDLDFQSNLSPVGRNEPLFYDKEMLKHWIRDEFRR